MALVAGCLPRRRGSACGPLHGLHQCADAAFEQKQKPPRSLASRAVLTSPATAAAAVVLFLPMQPQHQRYDPVTTGIGSLLVTGYCVVVHEQSVGEALNIAACATVLGMVSCVEKEKSWCVWHVCCGLSLIGTGHSAFMCLCVCRCMS